MESLHLIIIISSVICVAGIGAVAYVFMSGPSARSSGIRGLMSSGNLSSEGEFGDIEREAAIEDIKKATGSSSAKKGKEDIANKLFRAGYYTLEDRARFRRLQIIAPIVATPACAFGIYYLANNPLLTTSAIILGLFIGMAYPLSRLDKIIRIRQEEIMYYLPLVIEQISIGVSSALDVGPCISHIVTMADERDSHNPVTEMLVHVEKLIRSGLNLEDALVEVGEVSGMNEVKHAFMFLSSCAKHGGEISRQLQELADSVTVQRQVQVEGRISSLPVKATGPLATVFFGFFLLLFSGLLVRLMSAFGGST